MFAHRRLPLERQPAELVNFNDTATLDATAHHLATAMSDRAVLFTDELHGTNGDDSFYGESTPRLAIELMSGPFAAFGPVPGSRTLTLLEVGAGAGLFAAFLLDKGAFTDVICIECELARVDRMKAMVQAALCPAIVKYGLHPHEGMFGSKYRAKEDARLCSSVQAAYVCNKYFTPANNLAIAKRLDLSLPSYAVVVSLEPLPELGRARHAHRYQTALRKVVSWTDNPIEYYVYWLDAPPTTMPVSMAPATVRHQYQKSPLQVAATAAAALSDDTSMPPPTRRRRRMTCAIDDNDEGGPNGSDKPSKAPAVTTPASPDAPARPTHDGETNKDDDDDDHHDEEEEDNNFIEKDGDEPADEGEAATAAEEAAATAEEAEDDDGELLREIGVEDAESNGDNDAPLAELQKEDDDASSSSSSSSDSSSSSSSSTEAAAAATAQQPPPPTPAALELDMDVVDCC